MKSGLFVRTDKTKKIFGAINKLPAMEVLVGYPSDVDQRMGSPPAGKNARQDTGMTNAAIGYLMETGAPERNLPARPHVTPGIRNVQARITALWKQAGQAALKGNSALVDRILHAIGLEAQAGIRAKINAGPFAPLADATLAARRRRGRTGIKPLLDTGQLSNAVSYIIRRKLVTNFNIKVGSNYVPPAA